MRQMGQYDHLDEPLLVELTIEELARRVEGMNYGTHRFLTALVRVRREDPRVEGDPEGKILTDGIEELLNRGGF